MGDLSTLGYSVWRPGRKLAWIHFVHKSEGTQEWIYEPTEEEIVNLARRYGLNTLEILDLINMIDKKDLHICGFMVDVERYREAQEN